MVFADTQDLEIEELAKIKGVLECEAPNEILDVFDGNIAFQKENDNVHDHIPSSLRLKKEIMIVIENIQA